jgi:hypothetical protein
MTVREHLKKAHAAMAEHHRAMSACHTAAMGKGMDNQQEFHRAAASAHDAAAESHDAMCNECAKAMHADLAKVQPLPQGISRVAPDNPNIRPIPRYGAKPLATAVDEEFEFLVSNGDDRTK